jgi:hypothetical protein
MQLGSSLVGAAAGAMAGGTTQSAALGQSVAVTATTDNYLAHAQIQDKDAKLAAAKTDAERKAINDQYDQLNQQQAQEAATCVTGGNCPSVLLDKSYYQTIVDNLAASCQPPYTCSADTINSITELQTDFRKADAIYPDTTIEQILLGNKIVGTAIGVIADIAKGALGWATGSGVASDVAGSVAAQGGTATGAAEVLAKYGNSTTKLTHIFDDPTHNLGQLATQYGSSESAFAAVDAAAQQLAGRPGVVTQWIDVRGTPVWVRGTTVNGEFRIRTFSGNTANPKYPLPGE